MTEDTMTIVGVDACPGGWFATVLEEDEMWTALFDDFEEINSSYAEAKTILVDIPIGFPEGDRRQCDLDARTLLGSRGNSVFFPLCEAAVNCEDYNAANEKHPSRSGMASQCRRTVLARKFLK